MTLDQTALEWIVFSYVLIAGAAMASVCIIAKVAITGRAAIFERKHERENVTYLDRGRTRESER